MQTREELREAVKNANWYYEFADGDEWHRGRETQRKIDEAVESLECPWDKSDLRRAVHGRVVEDFVQVGDDKFKHPAWGGSAVPLRRDDLISRHEARKIMSWLENE